MQVLRKTSSSTVIIESRFFTDVQPAKWLLHAFDFFIFDEKPFLERQVFMNITQTWEIYEGCDYSNSFFFNNYKPSVCVIPWSLSNTYLFFFGHHSTISKDKLHSSACCSSEILYMWKLIWQTLLKSQASEMSKWVQFSFNCFLNPMCWEKTTEWKLLIKMLTCGTAEPQAGVWHAVPSADMPATWHPVLPPPSLPLGIPPPASAETRLDSESHRSAATFWKAGGLGKPSFRMICHGIILWINWGGHCSPSPNLSQLLHLLLEA